MTTEDRSDETPQETPKFVIVGDWLCVQVEDCTCDGGVDMPHRAECGLKPAATLTQVDAWLRKPPESKFDLAAANEVINTLGRQLGDAEQELERMRAAADDSTPADYCLLPGSHARGCTCGGGHQ